VSEYHSMTWGGISMLMLGILLGSTGTIAVCRGLIDAEIQSDPTTR
jgi:hypothetical protein